MSDRFQGRHHI
jgi:hypothetical protein